MSKKFLALMIGASLLAAQSAQAQTTDPRDLMRVVSYELLSQKRIGRTDFEYEYALTAENNTATDYSGVFVTLSSAQPNAQLIDARADIGAFNRFSKKKAADTIRVKVNRSTPFDPKSLGFAFDNDTLEGIDADNDGVRDDVEKFIEDLDLTPQQEPWVVAIAKAKQRNTLASVPDAEIVANYNLANEAAVCLLLSGYDTTNFLVLLSDIQANSTSRARALLDYEGRITDLGPFSLPSTTELESNCAIN